MGIFIVDYGQVGYGVFNCNLIQEVYKNMDYLQFGGFMKPKFHSTTRNIMCINQDLFQI